LCNRRQPDWTPRQFSERAAHSISDTRFTNGFGIGFVESWIQQITDDPGAPAVLNGFRGRAFGIGPIATYSTKLGKSHLDFSALWIHDFDVSNRGAGGGKPRTRLL
jgi:hypothetical protein